MSDEYKAPPIIIQRERGWAGFGYYWWEKDNPERGSCGIFDYAFEAGRDAKSLGYTHFEYVATYVDDNHPIYKGQEKALSKNMFEPHKLKPVQEPEAGKILDEPGNLYCFACDKWCGAGNELSGATYWTTRGNYGSTLVDFECDPLNTIDKLEIYICDECLDKKRDKIYSVFKQVKEEVQYKKGF